MRPSLTATSRSPSSSASSVKKGNAQDRYKVTGNKFTICWVDHTAIGDQEVELRRHGAL